MSARAVAVIRPAANIIARLAFLYILSGREEPVARFWGVIGIGERCFFMNRRRLGDPVCGGGHLR
jgi:hypothetical protein